MIRDVEPKAMDITLTDRLVTNTLSTSEATPKQKAMKDKEMAPKSPAPRFVKILLNFVIGTGEADQVVGG